MDQIVYDGRIWENLLNSDNRLEKLGLNLLTPEAKIVGTAVLAGEVPVKQAMIASGLSYRGFYLALQRLRGAGIVQVRKGKVDRRLRMISLVQTSATELGIPAMTMDGAI